jgi:hypothetical protein
VKKRLAKSERGETGIPHADIVKMLDSWILSGNGGRRSEA